MIPQTVTSTKYIRDAAKVVRGGSPRPAGHPRFFGGDYIPWLTVAALTNIRPSQSVVETALGFLTEEGSKRSRLLKAGTVIIANSGATLGVAKILGFDCCANDGIAALEQLEGVDPYFLCQWINTQTQTLRTRTATGNGQPNLNTTMIGNLRFPCPPLPEQQAIAEALSDADGVVEGLERLIEKKRCIKQGAMQDLLTAKRRLPGFSGEWVRTTLRKLLNGAPSYGINSAACPLGSGGHDYLRITDIDEYGQLRPDGRAEVLHSAAAHYFLKPNDIVVARTGASTGKSYIYRGPPERTVFAGFLIKLTPAPESMVPSFLFQFMQTDAYWSWITENSARSGQPGINGQQLSGLDLSVPADISEQKAIATILEDMDAEITAIEIRLQKARAIKEGMMQNLLTGRIRLV